jgi:crotonobetainyl-CoA:carnitine CoA-transferase CaiB-like acyl-CoA transferase
VGDDFNDVISRLWDATGTEEPAELLPGAVATSGPRVVLPAAFDVTGLATGAVAVATLAAAQLLAVRRGGALPGVAVDSRGACAVFAAEGLFAPIGWERPPLWDPIAGNYRTADGWIRLHTNYANHRAAVERVLGTQDRGATQAAVADRRAEDIERAIVEAGGAAAVMHHRSGWLSSAAGAATADIPLVTATVRRSSTNTTPASLAERPLAGVRVLDLTRVIAGPVCTKFLAGYGADVLRVDPPQFEEVASLLPETTLGKRTTALDLTAPADRASFEDLLAGADVLVSGLRTDALTRLGYDDQTLAALNPNLIVARLNAYGWTGPWQNRRGFDSLVQMSCGVAADGATSAGRDEPTPLPVQALDHATGWLLAAAVTRALTRRLADSVTASVYASLIGTANLLYTLTPPPERPPAPTTDDFAHEATTTAWGPARRVPLPGRIEGISPYWAQEAGPLGRHTPRWNMR